MTLQEKLPDLQISLSGLIRSIESEYRDLSQCKISDHAEGEIKKKLLNGVSGALDGLTDSYLLVSDILQLQADGYDISELLESLTDEPGADNGQ